MLCPACNNENPEKSKFCSECGAKLAPATTPAAVLPRAATHVTPAEPAKQAVFGERRTVTVLF
jgi:predicted amidophosphoribosyltransferase